MVSIILIPKRKGKLHCCPMPALLSVLQHSYTEYGLNYALKVECR
jgi:hypothetical protein